jgi:hypothetical protein
MIRGSEAERGSATLWALGLSMLLFGFGFLSLDLWSSFSSRQQAAAVADSAAIAGGSALDEAAYRTGSVVLDPVLAEQRAIEAAVRHPLWADDMTLAVSAAPAGVTVTVGRVIPFQYIGGLLPGQSAAVAVTGYAEPAPRG